MRRVLTTVSMTALALALSAQAHAASNPICLGEDVPFNPGHGEDVFVPPGYKIEAVATGLNFPSNIAFRSRGGGDFEIYVTEAGDSLPGRCNSEDRFEQAFPNSAATNPFLADIRVLNAHGQTLRIIGKADSVADKGDPAFLHAPTIGIAFENGFNGGRLIVSDSRQGIRGAQGPRNSSRVLQVDPLTGAIKQLVTGLPTGDHPTEQVTVHDGFIYWSQGSATNSGVVGHDNGAAVGGGPDLTIQHEIPCQDVVLSGNNSDSGDGHITGGYLAHGIPGTAGQVVHAFDGATQTGMCTGAILRARLDNPQATVEPVSWGYRNPFGIRFAPEDHVLRGALLVSENGEDERGARPTNNSPDRLHVTRGGLDYHGWPDRFGFLDSSQALYNPLGGGSDDNPAGVKGKPVLPLLEAPPQQPVDPLALEPSDVAVVGHDFVPRAFAGAGNPGDAVAVGDSLVTREGDFGFSPANGVPNIGHDIEKVHFLADGRIKTERFVFNCTAQVTDPLTGVARCTAPAGEAFAHGLRGINRPVDGKFGPDGAFYLVDFGAVRDNGNADSATKWLNAQDAPLVQIPGTGVIWKISRVGPARTAERDDR